MRRRAFAGRRTVLQLTPLLDLLLIVIFAQYLDVGERDRVRESQLREAKEQTQLAIQTADAQTERAAQMQAFAIASRERQQQTLATVSQLFRLPPDQRRELLASLPEADSSDDAELVRERLRELLSGNPDAVQLHLQTHQQLRRFADVWRVHYDARGVLQLEADGRATEVRIEEGDFVRVVYEWTKRQPQPKALVLILFSYDERARFLKVQSLKSRLPSLVELLRRDTESKVDFADIGYQRDPIARPEPDSPR